MTQRILIACILLIVNTIYASEIGALMFCPDTSITSQDSLWVIESEATNTPRDSLTIPPQILEGHTPQPAYPDSALAEGIAGQIIVAAYVDKQGDVMAWQFLRVEPEEWGFERAVEKVICQWRFAPATRLGFPINSRVGIPFNFKPETGK
jgi:TonB family protein